jgi:outer membrane protein TolC
MVRILLIAGLCAAPLAAQVAPARSPLDDLVAIALRDNPARRAEILATARAEAGVREARGLYLPSAAFNARYTELAGNTVDLGQLINPAFGALNQLLQRPAFPTDIDVQLPLRQETTLRLSQPVYQPAIRAAHRAAVALADARAAQRDAAAQELAADVRSSYIGYAQLAAAAAIHDSALVALDELVRVAERLVARGAATPDAVLRARAERSQVAQTRDIVAQGRDAARHSLNSLLNRPLETPIALLTDSSITTWELPALDDALRAARSGRHELRQLDHVARAVQARQQAARGSFLPSVALAVDYGVQGREYRFDRSRDFAAFTVVASWNLFNGGQDAARLQQAALEVREAAARREHTARGIELEVTTVWDAARVARQAIATATDRLTSAHRTFTLVQRRYDLGAATQLEYLDARAQWTAAELNLVATRHEYLTRRVALDRAAALYLLPAPALR